MNTPKTTLILSAQPHVPREYTLRSAGRVCRTLNCEREPRPSFGYCDECTAVVMRTGSPPVIARKPEWLRRLMPKDFTGTVLG